MLVDKPLSELCDSCTLSYWLRVPKADAGNVSIIGDQSGMIWGNIRKDGRVALVLRGKELLHSAKDVADDSWHRIAFTSTVDILSHPFEKEISEVARTIQERK